MARRRRTRLARAIPGRDAWETALLAAGLPLGAHAVSSALGGGIAGRLVEGALGAGAFAMGMRYVPRGPAGLGLAAGGVVALGSALFGDTVAAVLSGPPATSDPAIVPTIYSGNNLVGEILSVQDFLVQLMPPGLMLHSTMENLTAHGASITARVQALGIPEVWWGVSDDEHCGPRDANGACTFGDLHAGRITPDQLLTLRTGTGIAATAAGAPWLVWDAEPAWTAGEAGFNSYAAAAAIAGVDSIPGASRQALTTYPQPTQHGDFPWDGFRGVEAFLPNIYWGPFIGAPDVDGPTAYAGAAASISRSFQLGLLAPNTRIIPYLLMRGCLVAELGWVADHYAQVCCWTLKGGDTMDANGKAFMLAMVAIDRAGFKGVGRIGRYQTSKGLEANGKLDGDTLDALGVPRP